MDRLQRSAVLLVHID